MKVYIPFNSNDFNSVTATLSISPSKFYEIRSYSFKRSHKTKLNPYDNVLIGYSKPITLKSNFDTDNGYPLLIEIEVEETKLERVEGVTDLQFMFIPNTIFLDKNFKVIFRKKGEKEEIFGKSLRSIESKYVPIAESRSRLISDFDNVIEISSLSPSNFGATSQKLKVLDFEPERVLNKAQGIVLGNMVGQKQMMPKEAVNFQKAYSRLKNQLALYLNGLQEINRTALKEQVLAASQELRIICENTDPLFDAIMLSSSSGFSTDDLFRLKENKIFNFTLYDLVIEGLLSRAKNLPPQLNLEAFDRAIKKKFNHSYPETYIKNVSSAYENVATDVNRTLARIEDSNEISEGLIPTLIEGEWSYKGFESKEENDLASKILTFFMKKDTLASPDDLFAVKDLFLTELGMFLKKELDWFSKSDERNYVIALLSSFKSLRNIFEIRETNNVALQVLAILFTNARELDKFKQLIREYEIVNKDFAYTLWGAAYGAAGMPKTLTKSVIIEYDELLLKNYKMLVNELITNQLAFVTQTVHPEVVEDDRLVKAEMESENENNSDEQSSELHEPINDYAKPELSKEVDKGTESNKNQLLQDFRILLSKSNKIKSSDHFQFIMQIVSPYLEKDGSNLSMNKLLVEITTEAKNVKGFGETKILEVKSILKQLLGK